MVVWRKPPVRTFCFCPIIALNDASWYEPCEGTFIHTIHISYSSPTLLPFLAVLNLRRLDGASSASRKANHLWEFLRTFCFLRLGTPLMHDAVFSMIMIIGRLVVGKHLFRTEMISNPILSYGESSHRKGACHSWGSEKLGFEVEKIDRLKDGKCRHWDWQGTKSNWRS